MLSAFFFHTVNQRRPPKERPSPVQAPLTETSVAATSELGTDTSHQCDVKEMPKPAGPDHSYSVISPQELKRRLDEATDTIEVSGSKLPTPRWPRPQSLHTCGCVSDAEALEELTSQMWTSEGWKQHHHSVEIHGRITPNSGERRAALGQ